MIKALLLDLGGTLIDDSHHVLPGVRDALTRLRTFETADRTALPLCLVSDYAMPDPRTPAAIAIAFAEYLKILDRTGLREFFEPVDERVTLSTHVGVSKPAAVVFETALKRAKVDGPIRDVLFITEDAGHVATCRTLGMHALQFGADFTDWSDAPLAVARELGAAGTPNFRTALGPLLAEHGLQLQSVDSVAEATLRGTARRLVELDAPELGALKGVYVELPVDIEAKIDSAGKVTALTSAPHPDTVAEAVQQVESLASNRQIATDGASDSRSPVVPTHRVEADAQGRKVLRRTRFTAW